MKASLIIHRGEKRIKVDFPFNSEIASKLKQIQDARYSSTHKTWHIPYTKESFGKLKKLFPDVEYPRKINNIKNETANDIDSHVNRNVDSVKSEVKKSSEVSIYVFGRKIAIKLPKNDLDTHFLLGIRYSRWNSRQFCWIIPNFPGNLDLLKNYFKERISEIIFNEDLEINIHNNLKRIIGKNELLVIKTKIGRLRIISLSNIELTKTIKKIPYNNWDSDNKWWTIPYSEKFLNEIKTVASAQKLCLIYEEESIDINKTPRISSVNNPDYKLVPPEYILKLKELRYSPKTISTYKGMFEEFINYYKKNDISSIDESMITTFLRYLVLDRKVSISYQNQSINAIKFYFERVLGGQRQVYLVDRPRNEKRLPVVLSEQEVISIIKATENIKHKAILMLTYSAGLRISEVINVKISDIDSKRMQIRVIQSKGKKDRYTLLSSKLLEILRQYFKEYKPKDFLFEGATGDRYSERSIQAILKHSVQKAGINKWVSVHTLRHSFATHLLENGTDLRYIQSLLGHENSKTTEIYTHITTKGFDQIKSPLDKLDIF